MNEIISLSGLKKSYLNKSILEDITFNVKRGTFCALLGVNGAGKSTILNILMGHETIDEGKGEILGTNIYHDLGHLKNSIGFVTEKINYALPLSVNKFMKIYSRFFTKWDQDFFLNLIKKQELSLDKNFQEYSRGQKMQLALIAALSIKPDLLLIDEITSVLDLYSRKFFMDLLKKFTTEGGTVLITTNIISEIQHVTDKILIINQGRIKLDQYLHEIPSQFIKLRRDASQNNPIFENKQCYWSGNNSDGSSSFIVPKNIITQYEIGSDILDKRSVTLDEIFIYFIKEGRFIYD